MVTLSRTCIACRRLIPEAIESPVLTIGLANAKWNKKQNKHIGKLVDGEISCFCETCATKMLELIKSQHEKGVKVL